MNSTAIETPPAQVVTAAKAAIGLLPASRELTVGDPISNLGDATVAGQAIRAQFSGAAHGEIAIVVGQDLVDALADTPMGALDLTQAIRPAIEAAAATLGPVVVDPGDTSDPVEALSAILSVGGLVVPLVDGEEAHAVIALAVTARMAGHTGISTSRPPGLDLLHDVEMEVTAELGRSRMSVKELLSLLPGSVVELDRAAGGPADLLVNGRMIARGEVVVIDENFGIRITEIIPQSDRS